MPKYGTLSVCHVWCWVCFLCAFASSKTTLHWPFQGSHYYHNLIFFFFFLLLPLLAISIVAVQSLSTHWYTTPWYSSASRVSSSLHLNCIQNHFQYRLMVDFHATSQMHFSILWTFQCFPHETTIQKKKHKEHNKQRKTTTITTTTTIAFLPAKHVRVKFLVFTVQARDVVFIPILPILWTTYGTRSSRFQNLK